MTVTEPVPALRRRTPFTQAVPDALSTVVAELGPLSPASQPASGMPLPPNYITVQLRHQDATPDTVRALSTVIRENKSIFTGARVDFVYLTDPPVHGDSTDVPSTAFFEISLGFRV